MTEHDDAARPHSTAPATDLPGGAQSNEKQPATPQPATGHQYEIAVGNARAVITELGATLRLYEVDGVELTQSFSDEQIPPGACGVTLAPWANRIDRGKWEQQLPDGTTKTHQLDITEPSRGNATHGLLRNSGYQLIDHRTGSVTLRAGIFAQHGYPFHLDHEVRYQIGVDGHLTVRQSLVNLGNDAAPVALGAHPYFKVGDVPIDELTITIPGATTVIVDEESMIPTGTKPAEGKMDLREGRVIGDLRTDTGYTDLTRGDDDVVRGELRAPDGSGVQIWAGPTAKWLHVFITDDTAGLPLSVAIEPMTAPANAFNTGEGVHWLEPGQRFELVWGVRALRSATTV